jgi:hypothetical protein
MINANKNIFQILITEDESAEIPLALSSCISSVRALSNGHSHFVLRGSAVRELIGAQMGDPILMTYDGLVPFAYKADLARYCLLYLYGGWYFDIAGRLSVPLPVIESASHVFFRDAMNPGLPTWDVHNGLIYATQGSPIMMSAILGIAKNYAERWYGINALCPTGPNLLGRVVAEHGPDSSHVIGNYLPLTPMHECKNSAYVLADGTIIAFGKATTGTAAGAGLSGYGVTTGNFYGELYRNRNIYR